MLFSFLLKVSRKKKSLISHVLPKLHELRTPDSPLSGVKYVGSLLGFSDLLKKGFKKVLNSNTFVICYSVSLRWLICGILVVPPCHTKSKKQLVVFKKPSKSIEEPGV